MPPNVLRTVNPFEPYEVIPQPVWCCDEVGRCLYVNTFMTSVTGHPTGALQGYGYLEMVHPEDRARVRDVLLGQWMNHEPVEYEFRLSRASGDYHYVCARSQAVRSSAGIFLHWVSICHDIDSLKRAEQHQARQSELSGRLLKLTQALSRATDVQAALNLALQGSHEVLRAHGTMLYLCNDDETELILAGIHGYTDAERTTFQVVAGDADLPAAHALRVKKPLWIEDRLAERYPRMQQVVDTYRLQALACLPLRRRSRTFGVLVLDFTVPQTFDSDLCALLVGATEEIGQALVRTGLLSVRSRLGQYHALLTSITDQLTSTLTCAEVHRVVLQESAALTGAYGGFFTRLDPDGSTLRLETQWGYSSRFDDNRQTFPPESDLPVQVVRRTEQPIYLSSRDDLLLAFPDVIDTLEARTQALAVLPVRTDGQVTGTLTLSYGQPRAFDSFERQFLSALVAHTAQVLRRTRLYELEQAARTQAEEMARTEQLNQQALRSILDALPNLVWILTPEGLIQEFNSQWDLYTGRLLPHEREKWLDTIHPHDRETVWKLRTAGIQRGHPYNLELRIRRADGAYRWHVARVIPVMVDGLVARWIGSATDIDDQKRHEELLEQQVLERTRRWQDLNMELKAITTALTGSLEEPMRRTTGAVKLIEQRLSRLNQFSDDRTVRLFRLLQTETQRLSGVVQEIRQFSDLENREMRLSRVPLDQLVLQVRSDLNAYIRQQPVKWLLVSLPVVHADALLLRQVFAELFLLLVSRPAEGEETVISVSAVVQDRQVEVQLQSNGHFTADELRLLFSPFGLDLKPTRASGLANVRRTVQRHGGEVFTHHLGGRTVFSFTLPLWSEPPTTFGE